MSYYTEILILAGIRKDKLEEVQSELADPLKYDSDGLSMFLSLVAIAGESSFQFKASEHPFESEYCEDDEDFVGALKAPWSEPEDIAGWLARYADRDSRLHFHSLEADGLDFAYVFDGKGRFRDLELRPVGSWKKIERLNLKKKPKPLRKRSKK